MSFALDLAPDAQRGLASLPTAVQEETLDELDRLAECPELLAVRGASPDRVHDFISLQGDTSYYVFITVRQHRVGRVLEVKSIGCAVRPVE